MTRISRLVSFVLAGGIVAGSVDTPMPFSIAVHRPAHWHADSPRGTRCTPMSTALSDACGFEGGSPVDAGIVAKGSRG